MHKTISVLPGDGVGPEITKQAVEVLTYIGKQFGHNFRFVYAAIGASAIREYNNPIPEETLANCQSSDAILVGTVGDPHVEMNTRSTLSPKQVLNELTKTLQLYAHVRPIRIYPDLINASPLKKEHIEGVNLMIVKELTGGIYSEADDIPTQNKITASDTARYHQDEIRSVCKLAFSLAKKRKNHVTSVDKADVLETSKLWRETITEYAQHYKEVALTHFYIEDAVAEIIMNPSSFDVIVTEPMFGDILSSEASVMCPSQGLLAGGYIGQKQMLFAPVHGAYNKVAGQNIANPIASILSAMLLLRISFGMEKEALCLEHAVEQYLKDGYRTRDILSSTTPKEKILGTKEAGAAIVSFLQKESPSGGVNNI